MPISDCQVRDPRIRRTRQQLKDALKLLMETRGFDAISVQEITDTAQVNRATFYDHYTDKYALLEAMVAGDFHALLKEREIYFDGTCPSAARAIILAACDYLSQRQRSCQAQSAFTPLMDAAITAAIQRVLMQGLEDKPGPAAMVASATSCAIYGAVKQWHSTPDHPAAEEVVPQILALVIPMLQAALSGQLQAETASIDH